MCTTPRAPHEVHSTFLRTNSYFPPHVCSSALQSCRRAPADAVKTPVCLVPCIGARSDLGSSRCGCCSARSFPRCRCCTRPSWGLAPPAPSTTRNYWSISWSVSRCRFSAKSIASPATSCPPPGRRAALLPPPQSKCLLCRSLKVAFSRAVSCMTSEQPSVRYCVLCR